MEELNDYNEDNDMEMAVEDHVHNMPNEPIKIKKFTQSRNYSKIVQSYIASPQAKCGCKILLYLLGVFLIILIYVAIFELIAALLTWIGSTIILIIVHYFIFRWFCIFSTFPGSYKLWLREIEFKFGIETSYHVMHHLESVKSAIDLLMHGEVDHETLNEGITSINRYKNLTWIQYTTHTNIIKLYDMLKTTKISINGKTNTLLDLNIEYAYESDQSNSFQNLYEIIFLDHQSHNLVELIKEVIQNLRIIGQSSGIGGRLRLWYYPQIYKPFGTIEQMRSELEIRYNGIQTWATSYDGKKIDGMLIPAAQNLEATITDYKQCPTMLLCNPNAGYYEYITYQSEWLSYTSIGVNIAIWNYRGYGRSEGSPNPKNIRRDGECVLKHFKDHFGLTTLIGVHGESLGGSVAGYIAKTSNVDFLMANRTFSSLNDVPTKGMHPFLGAGFRGLTGYSDNVASDFVEAKCYKIVGCDSEDTLIK